MGKIYLVRHGQTAWNKDRIFRGRADVPLNEQGRREAACGAQALADVLFRIIYTSPLSRARETAEAIASTRGTEVRDDPAFTDIDYGEWTGLPEAEVRVKFAEQYEQWKSSPHLVRFPVGEDLQDVRTRSVRRLSELADEHGNDTIAVVSHRVVLKLLLCDLKGLDNSSFWDIQLDTAAISITESDGKALWLTAENETSHLQSLAEHDSADF